MLVWVASYPRSGNTLTMLTLRDGFGIGSLGAVYHGAEVHWEFIRDQETVPPTLEAPSRWQPPAPLARLKGDALLDALRDQPEPYFMKTHLASRASDPAPALYIVRDGRDALVSHAHFVAGEDAPRFRGLSFNRRLSELIRRGVRVQRGWSGNVRAWRERNAPTALIRFEDLIVDPVGVVARGCKELGVPLPEPEGDLYSFAELRERYPLVFRKGKVGSWREEMPPRLQERFWRIHGAQMESLGYRRQQ
jgi:hypothetical protein